MPLLRGQIVARPLLLAIIALWPALAGALTTVGYWRMEADLDPSANGLQVANEVAGGSSLISSEAFVDLVSNPNGTVPNTGSLNIGSLGGTIQGGNNGINATATWYSGLDLSSMTIEYWARTGENTATMISRTSGGADGLVITNPNSLDITYYVDDGAGGSTAVQLANVFNMDTVWRHYAFTYDEVLGIGAFYVDGVEVASNDGADNRALVWGNQVNLEVGRQMDYAAAFNGTMDELRIVDIALNAAQFLNIVPEPGTAGMLLVGLMGIALYGRCRKRSA